MGGLRLYGTLPSPATRAVLLTLSALKLKFEFIEVDLRRREHLTPEFKRLNPEGKVPVLQDGNNYLCDSHAIMAYLVRKYGRAGDPLYPRDCYRRAIVDQRLHFETARLFSLVHGTFMAVVVSGKSYDNLTEELKAIRNAYDLLEGFLGANHPYMAGAQLTIADFSIVSSVSTLVPLVPVSDVTYPKLAAWLSRMQKLPYYEEANQRGALLSNGLFYAKL